MWRHRRLVLLMGIAGVLAGLVAAAIQPPVYETTALMRLADLEAAGVFESLDRAEAEVYMARREDVASSRAVVERATELLGAGVTADEVRESVTLEADADLLALEVTARRGSAGGAADMANAVADAYQQISAERTQEKANQVMDELREAQASLQERIAEIEEQLGEVVGPEEDVDPTPQPGSRAAVIAARLQSHVDQLVEVEARMQEVNINAEVVGSGVETFEEALIPTSPVAPRPPLLMLLGAVLGLGLGGAVAYWKTGQAARVWTSADPARILGAPLLGRLPVVRDARPRRIPDDLRLDPSVTEAYQFLLNSIEYELARIGGSSILITSAGPAQGKTTACVHLALAAGRARERDIVLIDGDLRVQHLSGLLTDGEHPGLADLVTDDLALEDVVRTRPLTDEVSVWLIPAGEATRSPTFTRSPEFGEAMWRIRRAADLTIVDSAPILAVADTSMLAGHVDGIVLIVNDRTATADLTHVRERLSFLSTPLLGYVYVGDRSADLDLYGHYGLENPLRDRITRKLRRRFDRGSRWRRARARLNKSWRTAESWLRA